MGSGGGLSLKLETDTSICVNDGAYINNKGKKDALYTQLWHACAGPLVYVPRAGDNVFYFPQGHIEQVEAYTNKYGIDDMPIYNIPSKILCKVVHVQLKAEAPTDEVFAQITLHPVVEDFGCVAQEWQSPEDVASLSLTPTKSNAYSFSKRLTPSDTSTHGGFSVPKRYADECFPPLDMSQQSPALELEAKDLHGLKWRFRHIYRGQPKRHLLTSGWSTFVNTKKLVTGDRCIFLRGENGELYVGIRRAEKPKNTTASVLSGHSMQHGILASASHAISTGTMFTVYYRPWTSREFIIPCDRFMKSAENDCSVGTRFKMQFDGEEEQKISRFTGTVIAIEDIDCIKWPCSEWRCLKVKWDTSLASHLCSERVCPWSIEPIEAKNKKHTYILPTPKRPRPLDPSTPAFPALGKGILKCTSKYTPKRQSEVLQGQEIKKLGAYDLFHRGIGSKISILGENPLNSGFTTNFWLPTFASHCTHESVEVSKSSCIPNVNSSTSVSQDSKAEKSELEVPLAQKKGGVGCMLFGINIFDCQELPSSKFISSSKPRDDDSVPSAISTRRISETIEVSKPSENVSAHLLGNQCKNCCFIGNRTCTKVLKYGTALGRSVDLMRFDGYEELICELDQMFEFNGTLIDGSNDWRVTYTDGEGDMMLIGDYPWPLRNSGAWCVNCSSALRKEVDKLGPSSQQTLLRYDFDTY